MPNWVWWLLGSIVVSLVLSKLIGPAGFFVFLILPFGLSGLFRSRRNGNDRDGDER